MSEEISTTTLSAQALSRSFGPRSAVSEVTLELKKGEVLGFLGPNGAGKTTTMRMLSGNLAPSSGSVRICGIDLFARRCIEGHQFRVVWASVTYPPYLAPRQPPIVDAAPKGWRHHVQKGFSTMNFRILAAQALPRGRVFAALATGIIFAAAIASSSFAQTPAPAPAAPKAPKAPAAAPKAAPAPAAGASAAGGQAAAPAAAEQQQVQLIYQPWAKYCMKGQDANAKEVCFIGKDGRIESGQTVVAAVIIEPKGEPKKISIPYSEIAGLAFTGRDTAAGKSWEAWLKKYWEKKLAGESDIELKPESLE